MSGHTPGPWVLSFESADPEWAVITTKGGAVIANVNADSRQESNAHLIAAAPDLLAVCEALVRYQNLIDRNATTGLLEAYAAAFEGAEVAIEKATGAKP